MLSLAFVTDRALPQPCTLSLHDALPIYGEAEQVSAPGQTATWLAGDQMSGKHPEPDPPWPRWFVAYVPQAAHVGEDRKSTRLNSSHANISYAVFCLKKKKKTKHKCDS